MTIHVIMVDSSRLFGFSLIHRRLTTVQEIEEKVSRQGDETPLTACAVKRRSQAKTLVTKPAAAIATLPCILMHVME